MDLTAFCLFFPEMSFSRSLRPAAGRRTRIGAVDDPDLSPRTEMVDGLGEGTQPGATVQPRAASIGRSSPNARDGAVDTEPAGQHIVRDAVPQVNEGGQQPVDEDQPVLRTGPDRPAPRALRKQGLVPLVPQRADRSDEFSKAARARVPTHGNRDQLSRLHLAPANHAR